MSVTYLTRDAYQLPIELQKVEGEASIVRDKYNRALLLNDTKVLQEYERTREDRIEKAQAKEKLAELEVTVASLKEDVTEIKQLLLAIVNK